jgi:hypothetical protein
MKIFISALIVLCAFSACKKDKVEPVENVNCEEKESDSIPIGEEKENMFFPLSIGSYWVYEFHTHNQDGTISNINQIDTVKVLGDSIINGENYATFKSNFPGNNVLSFYRNHNGDIIAKNGYLICPFDSTLIPAYNNHYGKIGNDTTYHYWEEFSGYESVATQFGNFDCIRKSINHNYYPNYGVGLVIDTVYYSPIGILQTSFSYSGGTKTVGTLIDYHIE